MRWRIDGRLAPLVAALACCAAAGADFEPLAYYPATAARQGVAVDALHLYAIDSRAIEKVRRADGAVLDRWEAKDPAIQHLNSGERMDLTVTRADGSDAVISVKLDEIMNELGRQEP